MTIEELIQALKELKAPSEVDAEDPHHKADQLLIEYINDERVTTAYEEIIKWYA